jgi:hypothetical protein
MIPCEATDTSRIIEFQGVSPPPNSIQPVTYASVMDAMTASEYLPPLIPRDVTDPSTIDREFSSR